MSPTCSKSDLAGRKALSTADLTIFSSGGGARTLRPSLTGSEVYDMDLAPATDNRQS